MAHTVVKRAHIIPQTYLRNFSDRDRIVLRLAGSTEVFPSTVDKVGVRKRFYRRTRPDGTQNDDVERSLAFLEGAATPILRGVAERWPLARAEKNDLAEFFAAQHVRGPRWFDHHSKFLDRQIEKWRDGRDLEGLSRQPTDSELGHAKEVLGSDTQALIQMLSLIPKVKTLFASMHWTLLRFGGLALALSDHPVVSWPLGERARPPEAGTYATGLLKTLEWAVPVSSQSAIVMSWIDDEDVKEPIAGAQHHARTLNSFVVAQAGPQWFHHPGARPKRASGPLTPLTPQLHRGYSVAQAEKSERRARVSAILNAKIGSRLDTESSIVTVRRKSG
jgi:hypothetical protein